MAEEAMLRVPITKTNMRRALAAALLLAAGVGHGALAQQPTDTTHVAPAPDRAKHAVKDHAMAYALGMAIPGAGHIYAGETTTGALFGATALTGAVIAFRGAEGATSEAGAVIWIGAWAASLFDLPRALRSHEDRPIFALGADRRGLVIALSLRSP